MHKIKAISAYHNGRLVETYPDIDSFALSFDPRPFDRLVIARGGADDILDLSAVEGLKYLLRDAVGRQPIDCRSPEGITIGLIDAVITLSHVIKDRDLNSPEVREALADLASSCDMDVKRS